RPALNVSASSSVQEGSLISLGGIVSDVGSLDTHPVFVNWGDASGIQSFALPANRQFSANHLYTVPGNYQVITTVQDDDGASALDSRTLTVRDFAPVIAAQNLGSVFEGQLLTRTGSFTDLSGLADSWTGTVRYDGGSALPLPINLDKTFLLQH